MCTVNPFLKSSFCVVLGNTQLCQETLLFFWVYFVHSMDPGITCELLSVCYLGMCGKELKKALPGYSSHFWQLNTEFSLNISNILPGLYAIFFLLLFKINLKCSVSEFCLYFVLEHSKSLQRKLKGLYFCKWSLSHISKACQQKSNPAVVVEYSHSYPSWSDIRLILLHIHITTMTYSLHYFSSRYYKIKSPTINISY